MLLGAVGVRSESYRADVDGLRGIAIGSVLLFHLFPDLLPGGFVEVDVFFVISGFLITRQLREHVGAGTFRFRDFYTRRVRRLAPALLLVVAVTLLAGWDVLLRAEFQSLGESSSAGLLFAANLLLFQQGGYFDRAAIFKPLHHLWSLGVEEQFYLLWPALVVWSKDRWRWALAALMLLSFIANLWLTMEDPHAAFFLPFGRLWQFGAGALVAFSSTRGRPWAAWLGLVLIIGGLAVSRSADYPGLFALLPTVGAALLIHSGPDAWVSRRLLAWRGLTALGLISYPLYLWHWPVMVFAVFMQGGDQALTVNALPRLGVGPSIVVLVSSVLASWATERWVERPIRVQRRVGVPALLVASVVLTLISVAIALKVLPSRAEPTPFERLEAPRADWIFPTPSLHDATVGALTVHLGPGGDPRILFVGDSNMEQYAPAIEARLARGPTLPFAFVTRGGCPLFLQTDDAGCNTFVAAAKQWVTESSASTVVVAAQWAMYFDNPRFHRNGQRIPLGDPQAERDWTDFEQWLQSLAKTKRVVIVSNTPSAQSVDPPLRARRSWSKGTHLDVSPVSRQELEQLVAPVVSRLRSMTQRDGFEFVDPFDTLCDAQWCPTVSEQGIGIYKDAYHVRAYFIRERFHAFDTLLDPG